MASEGLRCTPEAMAAAAAPAELPAHQKTPPAIQPPGLSTTPTASPSHLLTPCLRQLTRATSLWRCMHGYMPCQYALHVSIVTATDPRLAGGLRSQAMVVTCCCRAVAGAMLQGLPNGTKVERTVYLLLGGSWHGRSCRCCWGGRCRRGSRCRCRWNRRGRRRHLSRLGSQCSFFRSLCRFYLGRPLLSLLLLLLQWSALVSNDVGVSSATAQSHGLQLQSRSLKALSSLVICHCSKVEHCKGTTADSQVCCEGLRQACSDGRALMCIGQQVLRTSEGALPEGQTLPAPPVPQ